MKQRGILLFAALLCILMHNSCKKNNFENVDALLSSGPWELASLRVFNYVGDTQQATDTLNEDCTYKQVFTFNNDNTCTYTNYSCVEQKTTGTWALSKEKLYLMADISCADTTAAGTAKPFTNARIVNLGQYSFVIQTGDLQSNYTTNQRRRIVQYGFVRQKNN